MDQREIKAVIWDVDGTMLDTERLQVECWEKVLTMHGYSDFDDVLRGMIGRTAEASNQMLREKFGSAFPAEDMRDEKNVFIERCMKAEGVPLKPGITEVLTWLSRKKIPCVAASSTDSTRVAARLEETDLLKYFRFILGGNDVVNGKPHPEIFLAAATLLKVDPAACLVFEDSHNGVIAAHVAGMHVVMVPDLVAPTPEILKRVKHELGSLEEAVPLLVRIFGK